MYPLFSLLALTVLLAGCLHSPTDSQAMTSAEFDYLVVDCFFPGRIVPGAMTGAPGFIAPAPPERVFGIDCKERGGMYEAPTRAWTVKVWTPLAEQGNKDAQYFMGEAYELGLDVAPDYGKAAYWYEKAARQGHGPAATMLAHLYESGRGVEFDLVKALEWFQVASGSDRDLQAALQQTATVLERVRARLAIHATRNQDQSLGPLLAAADRDEVEIRGAEPNPMSQRAELEVMSDVPSVPASGAYCKDVKPFRVSNGALSSQLAALNKRHAELEKQAGTNAAGSMPTRATLGEFRAMLIANERYNHWNSLQTPVKDARAIGLILEGRFGFARPSTIIDPDAKDFRRQVHDFVESINKRAAEVGREKINVLIYYAGHGSTESNVEGCSFWIPKDGPLNWTQYAWVSDREMARDFQQIEARQVLVIADSCFDDVMGEEGLLPFAGAATDKDRILFEESRVILASGGTRPIEQAGGHSEFGYRLIAALQAVKGTSGVVRGVDIYENIARQSQKDRLPSYGTLRHSSAHTKNASSAGFTGDFTMILQ